MLVDGLLTPQVTRGTATIDAEQELDGREVLAGTNRSHRFDGAVAVLLAAAGCRANVILSWRGGRRADDRFVIITVDFLGAVSIYRADTAYPEARTAVNR